MRGVITRMVLEETSKDLEIIKGKQKEEQKINGKQ